MRTAASVVTVKEKQHIALFLPGLHEGGAERVMVNLANAFAARGHVVDLVLANKVGPYLNEVSENVNVIDLGCSRVFAALLPLTNYLRKNKPDSLFSTLTHANIVAIVAAKLSCVRMKVVVREAGLPSLNDKQSQSETPVSFFKLAKFIFPFADSVVCVSTGVKNELIALLGIDKKVDHVVVSNPVISDKLYKLADSSINEEHNEIYHKTVVLGVGRLAPEKDFQTLVRAFSRVRETADCNLLILGSGELEHELKQLAEDLGVSGSVYFPGFVGNPYPYLKKCSTFVLSSVSEGLPNALIEALALGIPVVSTKIENGPTEILENGRWGLLVETGDSDAMCSAIVSTLSSEHRGIPLQEQWWKNFSESSVVEKYLELLSAP